MNLIFIPRADHDRVSLGCSDLRNTTLEVVGDELDRSIQLPELRTFSAPDFFETADADELAEIAQMDLQCSYMARLELDSRS